MPTYQYACTECDHAFEQFQSFSDDALSVCPRCEGRLRKVYNAVGVVFKGSGFYRNDSRADAKANGSGTSGSATESGVDEDRRLGLVGLRHVGEEDRHQVGQEVRDHVRDEAREDVGHLEHGGPADHPVDRARSPSAARSPGELVDRACGRAPTRSPRSS